MTTPLVASANLLVGRGQKEVRQGVDKHLSLGALAVAFQEAGGYRRIIKDEARDHDYRKPIIAPAAAGRGLNSSILVIRKDVHVYASGVAKVYVPWIGPRIGIHWPGRGFPWAVVELEGKRTLVASIHMPTGRHGRNQRAWRRCLARLHKLIQKHRVEAFILLGDWNCPASDKDADSVRDWAKSIGAHLVRTGTPIDYAVVHGFNLRGDTGPKFGSDHWSVRFYRR